MLTAQYRIPEAKRVENGITGTILDTSREEDRVTIKTREREPREVDVNTSEFADISLAYSVRVHKGQGLTVETSGILTGGRQTDKEHAYVAVSRAREQTQIYTSREDLGEQGMDLGAIERLAERIERSRAQEVTIAKETAERESANAPERDSHPPGTTAAIPPPHGRGRGRDRPRPAQSRHRARGEQNARACPGNRQRHKARPDRHQRDHPKHLRTRPRARTPTRPASRTTTR